MNKRAVIKEAEGFVKKALGKEGTGHDWWHIERVRNNAKAILKTEKDADAFIVDIALLLHDVGDRKVINASDDDYSIAENFLNGQKLSQQIIERVMFIIKNMSFTNSIGASQRDFPKEFYVAQDADRLDALGAIGIARTFAFGGSRSRPLYDPTKKAHQLKTKEDVKTMQSSSFHHFFEKVLLLKGLMNTRTAKNIAAKRHKYVEQYTVQFLNEWNGKL